MIPGITNIPVYKGAKFEHELEFFDDETDLPLDLTGLGPFVATFKQGDITFNATVVSDYDNTGTITLVVLADVTNTLAIGTVDFGLRDNLNNPYIESVLNVKKFTPSPNLA